MAEIVRMPKMSDTMTEGVISKWHKKVGDKIKSGDLVAEIETDKATMDFESFQEGVLLYIGVKEGQAVPVDSIIAILGKEGEEYQHLLKDEKVKESPEEQKVNSSKAEPPRKIQAEVEKTKKTSSVVLEQESNDKANNGHNRLKASPLARKLAQEKGIDLSRLQGTGEKGRIVKRDIDWYKPNLYVSKSSSLVQKEEYEEVPVSQMRKTIAKRLSESKFSSPHFYLTCEVNMDQLVEAREKINQLIDHKISFNDIVVKAVAIALKNHPKVNSSWLDDKIRYNHHVHIGVAIAVEEGLLVPVIRFADQKTLSQIAIEVKDYSQKAKDKKLQPSDWEGNTFTISNLGMFGIEEFTAIINPPDACILAVGAINQKPVVRNNQIVSSHIMKVTLSCDHRIVDGVTGASFLQTLTFLLENPVILLGQDNI